MGLLFVAIVLAAPDGIFGRLLSLVRRKAPKGAGDA
jgi:hypothetical protein